ncbi:MAG: class I tRNA ligase family protein, partial [Mycoplasma sp.]
LKVVTNFTNQLSQWYFDIIKDDLYCLSANDKSRRCIQTTLFIIVKSLIIALTPIIPHTCEEAYQQLKFKDKLESVALENFPEIKTNFNLDSFNEIELFFQHKDEIFLNLENARKEGLIKKNNEAIVTIPNSINIDLINMAKWLNVAKVESTDGPISVRYSNFDKCQRCWNHIESINMKDAEICQRCYNVINKK